MKTLITTLLITVGAIAAELPTVQNVDLERYLGTWYEIARFDQKFQRGCTAVSATYSIGSDGDIKVLNSCRLDHPSGELKLAEGRAWLKNERSSSKLKVQFFLSNYRINIFAGNYWIIDLDEENYSYAVVGDPSRKYFWILSRTPDMDEELFEDIKTRATDLGFNMNNLLKTIH